MINFSIRDNQSKIIPEEAYELEPVISIVEKNTIMKIVGTVGKSIIICYI